MNALLKKLQADFLLLDDPTNIFYLTGLHFSTSRLLISKKSQTLFVDDRYSENAKRQFKEKVIAAKNLEEAVAKLLKPGQKVAISSNHVTLDRFLQWKKIKGIKWIPIPNLLAPLRMIKSSEEVKKIKEACAITQAGYEYLLKQIKAGVTEKELSRKLQIFFLEQGATDAFSPIICFGTNSSLPHHTPTDRPYKKGEIVQFDIGCQKEGYCSDFSRVCHVPKNLQGIEQIVQLAKKAAEAAAIPGNTMRDVDQAARIVIEKAGYGEFFLHSIGHGVGLDIHETPLVKGDPTLPLQEGMVITIEPGIYLQGVGGIRIEDSYLITKKGPLNLFGKG